MTWLERAIQDNPDKVELRLADSVDLTEFERQVEEARKKLRFLVWLAGGQND